MLKSFRPVGSLLPLSHVVACFSQLLENVRTAGATPEESPGGESLQTFPSPSQYRGRAHTRDPVGVSPWETNPTHSSGGFHFYSVN